MAFSDYIRNQVLANTIVIVQEQLEDQIEIDDQLLTVSILKTIENCLFYLYLCEGYRA